MKVWTTVKIKDDNKDVKLIANSFSNYLYRNGPILDIYYKYNISQTDKYILEKDIKDKIAGLLMLYLSKNTERINDIANKYNLNNNDIDTIIPTIEAYIEKNKS